ncbi:MAG: alpha-L-fucosidase [Bacteroidota bacterium]|nr:alpha-L-fucosidase [Bacteroidota bacterium]
MNQKSTCLILLCFVLSCAVLFAQKTQRGANREKYYLKSVSFPEGATLDQKVKLSSRVIPSPQQIAWQNLEMTAFCHFTVNTFTDKEWGDGTESPEVFNPTQLNADQWVSTLKDAGAKLVILTCKHHDGFCLWPTKVTDHSVASSKWKNGKGDVVREVSNACRKYGVKFGVYLSPWDRNARCYGDSPAYNKYFMSQLTELLTQYGRVDEVWFDGACGEGPNGKKQEYDWAAYYKLIHKLQPQAAIAVMGEDIRWVGTESGYGRETEWSVTTLAPGGTKAMKDLRKKLGIDEMTPDLGGRDQINKADHAFWYPSEVDVSIRPGWFYHSTEDKQVKSLNQLVDIYFSSVGRNSLLLLNVPPDRRGLINENDVQRLHEFKQYIDKTFSRNLILKAKSGTKGAGFAVDGNNTTAWSPSMIHSSAVFETVKPVSFNTAMLQEDITKGQRVESFTIEAYVDGKWNQIAQSTTIGYKKLLRFPKVVTNKVRLSITGSRDLPNISNFGLFNAPELAADPVILRNKKGDVKINCESPFAIIKYTLDGSEPNKNSLTYTTPIALAAGGVVKAKTFINDFAQSSATFTEEFDLCPAKWSVINTDSEQDGFEASKAIDGDYSTFWHTSWKQDAPAQPHQITVSLGEELNIKGFTYTPRNDASLTGIIFRYEFWVSEDGTNWTKVDSTGEFSNIKNNPIKQTVLFNKTYPAKYFKLVSKEEVDGKKFTSAAEIGLITK